MAPVHELTCIIDFHAQRMRTWTGFCRDSVNFVNFDRNIL